MEPTLEGAMALARSATGPLSPHLTAFVTSLIEQRYAIISVRAKAWRAAAFDAWLHTQGIQLADLCEAHIDQYSRRQYQPRSDCRSKPHRHEAPALLQLLRYLQAQGLCATPATRTLPVDSLLADFEHFLLRDRGLAVGTVSGYRVSVREFLIDRFASGRIDFGVLRARDIINFVQRQPRSPRPHALKHVVTALRAFLRWGQYRGELDAPLISAVPTVASWSTTPPLPRAISAEHARRVIDSCDPTTAVGLRDRAVLLLLARLGLRGGELITLLLDDIDWDDGRLRVRGKNGRECLMPLPTDAGEAIVAYLRSGRPPSTDRHLFLRVRAPVRGLLHGSDGIGSIVRNALERAGIDAPHKGSHQFRHALAVRMLQGGASLPEIGEVLRHRDPASTSIYARVDVAALRSLSLPWPGGVA
ncbi:site-specific recombinase XerD [Paraburkholderia tropica]|uniref:Site-specific recombinase XerD n=1 Tax=Paraburkholderia tropica TaxID=92647 RepID=A0ABX5MG68_9BURK|nr:tyrosine-type recombinase/integrase [Paraburkholderia tropica]PXX07150.1 site-specific recombinase XerD [Paraburkholderia tropica]PZW72686.1 site-specific recombinase XerD [Paraburkholderia tropica]